MQCVSNVRGRCAFYVPVLLILLTLAIAACGRKNPLAPTSASTGSASVEDAVVATGPARTAPSGAIHLEGAGGRGARWSIDVPEDWNHDLVVYLHGYSNPADPVRLPELASLRDALLARGFAIAVSSFSENGYAVKDGVLRSHELSGRFASRVAKPNRTYLVGQSMGGLVGLLMVQRYPRQYDGGLFVCGIVGGMDDEVEYLGDVRVLFDAVYPGVLPGGLEHPPVITDVNTQVVGPVLAAIGARPEGVGVIQELARRPLPGRDTAELVTSLLNVLGFAMQGGNDLLNHTHGHTYFDNADHRYTSARLPASIVEDVNARVARHRATPDAKAYLAHYGEPSGDFAVPVLALHTTRDPVVPAFHEDLFADAAAGPWLLQRRVERYGHCAFEVGELMNQFDTMVGWSTRGVKPTQ